VDVYVSLNDNRNVVSQIYRQLRAAILDGRLSPSQALPPTRELAVGLNVSRNSVLAAYSRLSEDGFVVSRVGAGSFVSSDVSGTMGKQHGRVQTLLRPRPFWASFPELEYFDKTPATYDFRSGMPDAALFPFPTWRRLMTQELRVSNQRIGQYGHPAGHPGLRSAISRHVGVTRGVRSAADNITVTSGTQQALDLIARVFLNPGDCVAVEEPGYPPARLVFESYGARVAAVELDEQGININALPDETKLIFLTPSHQYPTGISMPLERRREGTFVGGTTQRHSN